jgi:hypothetical protein
MELTEKAKIYRNVWCCAYQRRHMYRNTPREHREHETILMCLNMKDARWAQFDTEKRRFLN